MSINMTQDFVFETDDIKSFAMMLGSVAPVLFQERGDYTRPFVRTNNDGLFDDGKYENYRRDDVAMFSDYLDREHTLIEPAATYGGATVYKNVRDYVGNFVQSNNKDEAARMVCARREEPQPIRIFICTLGDYKTDAAKPDAIGYRTIADQVGAAMKIVLDFDVKIVEQELQGRPFEPWRDGTLSYGWRMAYRPNGGWNLLDLSAIHVYYGK